MLQISLPPGDWDVEGMMTFNAAGATITGLTAGINSTTATLPTDGGEAYSGLTMTTGTAKQSIALPRRRYNLATYTDIFMVAKATFSVGTVGAYGVLTARLVPPYQP